MFILPSLASTEWRSGGLPGNRAAATYRVLLFLAAGCARTRAGFVVVAAEGGPGGAGDLLRLLLR